MNKNTLINFLQKGFEEVESFAHTATLDAYYFKPADNVWSAAENMQHLIQSVQPLTRLLGRPKSYFLEKWGIAKHVSRPYEEVMSAYHAALGAGVVATGAFAPLAPNPDLDIVLGEFTQTNEALIHCLGNWSEEELDKYLIPHPLMGPLTVREMMLFTAYHTRHHLEIMQKRVDLVAS